MNLLGIPRKPGTMITQHYKDVAYATQKTLEACVVELVTHLHHKTGVRKLCLAGGVGLNSVANYRLYELDFIEEIFIQPAASDRGISLGCALYGNKQEGQSIKNITHVFKGPTYPPSKILNDLELAGVSYARLYPFTGQSYGNSVN